MSLKRIFTPKVVLVAILLAVILFCLLIVYLLVYPPLTEAGLQPSGFVSFTVIPAPTSTVPTQAPSLSAPPSGPLTSPTPAPGEIAVGVYVQVAAGVDALNLRLQPGLDAERLFLAFDSEVFLVKEGPEQADGYTWWYLEAPYGTTRSGWAVHDFLVAIPSP
jgi:hypothetical protein